MKKKIFTRIQPLILSIVMLLLLPWPAQAKIDGITGPSFNFTVKDGYLTTGEGWYLYFWGFANGTGEPQYVGPTMIVNQGDTVVITMTNNLPPFTTPQNVSMVFPGHEDVTATGGTPGLLTNEAAPGQTVTYRFTAAKPGTYMYHSGTQPELQVEMGLVGAIIVRPTGFNPMNPKAYNHADSSYDLEYLFFATEMDPYIHEIVEVLGPEYLAGFGYIDDYFPNYWFLNGRNAPDTMLGPNDPFLPNQPYDCMPLMRPGDRVLVRIVGGGRDLHPLHLHGNHFKVIARDGRLLESTPGAGADLAFMQFTNQTVPGETTDAIFEWTGKDLGWDIYGTGPDYAHTCNGLTGPSSGYDPDTKEYCPDHGKPFPVVLPDLRDLTFGGMYSGSPFLGTMGALPPGQGGLNPWGGFAYMWHSHAEKEIVNYNIFPGGLMTMLVIVAPGTELMQ